MKTTFLILAATLALAGCVNVHVHFPAAPAEPPAHDAGISAPQSK